MTVDPEVYRSFMRGHVQQGVYQGMIDGVSYIVQRRAISSKGEGCWYWRPSDTARATTGPFSSRKTAIIAAIAAAREGCDDM